MRDVALMVLQQRWEELPVKVGFTHAGRKCWATCGTAEEALKITRVISDLGVNSCSCEELAHHCEFQYQGTKVVTELPD